MELESPDVENDFPGLYSTDSTRKTNDSDFSDDSHDKSFKKDLMSKKKEKKDKKDKGYAALEGESSPDDDSKSPSKSKKTKSFIFPVKKSEKREKSREKEGKEKDVVEKDKKKDKKDKSKIKDLKKKKHTDDEELGVFCVPLQKAIDRLGCLDGVQLPLPVRHAIESMTTHGLNYEGLYKMSSTKLKLVDSLKKSYNGRELISIDNVEPNVAAALLFTFLKELPEPILTQELLARFEEAAAQKEVRQRESELNSLINHLPQCNRTLLAWLIVHFDQVTEHEKQNKLNAQTIAIIFSPVLQMSHRLLTAFLCHAKFLFPDTILLKYIPPLTQSNKFPEDMLGLQHELIKQESLLSQIHLCMNEGLVSTQREEQLWEVQRIVTQLKRKLKSFHKPCETKDENQTEVSADNTVESKVVENKIQEADKEIKVVQQATADSEVQTIESLDGAIPFTEETQPPINEHVQKPPTDLWKTEELRLQLEQVELLNFKSLLQDRIIQERIIAEKLRKQIESYRGFMDSESDESSTDSTPACLSPETEAKIDSLLEENILLKQRKDDLIKQILEEREACMKLNVHINMIERMNKVQ